ncbi:uncharacterized protein LOC111341866 [Stylophora pistillata]|uniref:Uncharacterized protein n=1 Tax=Stylophora pistillata TaxID=50429 RepID=A0A2B4RK15_STYPI|nr:uncharacterized protein LOC111341866 [Stylophora pistillata]PFX16698.1 hypothetical protein AWC38_SpisGene19014 [Stylophora pistillata]
MEVLGDEITSLRTEILEYNIGKYQTFHDALEGEMEGCFLNIVFFGMFGSGKSALINSIHKALSLEEEPAIIQNTGKDGTKALESFVLPGIPVKLYDTRGFFAMDIKEEGELFRILFGIHRPGEELKRDHESAQLAEAAGPAAYKLEKRPLVDQMHVVFWVIKGVDIRFEKGKYREIITFVQEQLKRAIITIFTVITFDDEIQKRPNADDEREKLTSEAIEVTGGDKKKVFFIANPARGQDLDPIYKKRVLEMLEQALDCGERSIRVRQTKRENGKKQARNSESAVDGLRSPVPVENDDQPPLIPFKSFP